MRRTCYAPPKEDGEDLLKELIVSVTILGDAGREESRIMMMQDISIYQHLESRGKTEPPGNAVASLHQVYKHFDRIEALKGVSLKLFADELLALLGLNSSGKTTTISILLGLCKPDQGIARLFGQDPHLPQARKQVGATSQETGFPSILKVGEIITLVQIHYPLPSPTKGLLTRFGLTGLENRQGGGLSGGQKWRLAVVLAFPGNQRLVFLDEPTVGLDSEARRELWQEIDAYRQHSGAVLLTTHYKHITPHLVQPAILRDPKVCELLREVCQELEASDGEKAR